MKRTKTILSLLGFVLTIQLGHAQTKPVSANIQVLPPYTAVYADYVSVVNNKIRGSIILNDLNEPSLDVRLHLVIEGEGIKLETKPTYIGSRLTLTPGAPLPIDISTLGEYLNLNNLDFFGITRQNFANQGKFPEGFYTFSLIVKEYHTGKTISNPAIATAWLRLNDEPTIISPQIGKVIPINGPQNIFFQWQLNSPVNIGQPFTPVYKFFLYEVLPNESDPIYALNNGRTILVYESPELFTTSLQYNLNMPVLDPGKRYLFRVQAIDPTGNNVFRNDGFSPPVWFYYGYPEGGVIENLEVPDGYRFKENDPKILTWSAPDNLIQDQSYTYKLKIIQIEDKDAAPEPEDFQYAPAWLETTTPPTTSTEEYAFEIKKEFDKNKWYAWYVTAHSGQQTIAASEVKTFQGPSLIGFLKAGNHTVFISELENEDLNNLKGSGNIKIFETDTDSTLTQVEFEGLKVKKIAGRFVLEDGTIEYDIKEELEFKLSPRYKDNKEAYFYPQKVRLDKEELAVYGHAEWNFPIPINGGEPLIKTEPNWVNFDQYKPFGTTFLPENTRFDLLDPFGFKLIFENTSEIQLIKDEYVLKLNGQVECSDKVSDVDGNPLRLSFERVEQLFYIEQTEKSFQSPIRPINGIELSLNTNDFILDLSEEKSPKKVNGDDWKGLYLRNVTVSLPKDFDPSNQLAFRQDYDLKYNQNISRDIQTWIDGQGLTFVWEHDFNDEQISSFNTFPMKMGVAKIDIRGNALSDSQFEGGILVPIINTTKSYPVIIPLTENGFGVGFFDGSLDKTFTFSAYGGENKAIFTIKQAKFADNDRLQLAVDIDIPALGFSRPVSVNDFRIYGDYFIGFGKKNGSVDVGRQEGIYQGYKFELNRIGASLQGEDYVFSYQGTMKLDPEFSNPDGGSPVVSFHSTARVSDEIQNATYGIQVEPDIPKPAIAGDFNSKQIQMTFAFAFKNAFLDIKSELYRLKEDPEWGTRFKGEIHGNLLQPAKMKMGGLLTFGSVNGNEYFYMDAYAADENGQGVTVYPDVNMVGFEGRMFHKMDIKDGALALNKRVDFGAALYGQFIDFSTLGQKFMLDAAMEMKSTSSNLEIKIKGDISLFNQSGRSPTMLANAIDSLKEELVKEGIKQALRTIGPIEYEIEMGGGVTSLFKLDENSGSIAFDQGDVKAEVYGELDGGGAFGGITLDVGENKLNIEGDLNDRVSGSFENQKLSSRMDYDPNINGGRFKINYEDYTVSGSVDQNAKKGHMELLPGVDIKLLGEASYAAQEGTFQLESGKLKLKSDVKLSSKSGEFDVNYDGNAFAFAANGQEQTGEVSFAVNGVEAGASFNNSEGSGSLDFATSDISGEVKASKQGIIDLFSEFSGNSVKLFADANNGGTIDLDIKGKSAKGWMKKEGMGGIELDMGSTKIIAEAHPADKFGSIQLETPDIKLSAMGNPEEPMGSLNLEVEDLKVNGNYTEQQHGFRAVKGTGYVRMNRGTTDFDGAVRYGSDSVAVVYQPSDLKGRVNLAYGNSFINGEVNLNEFLAGLEMNVEGMSCSFDIELDKTKFKYEVSEGCSVDLNLAFDFDAKMPSIDFSIPSIGFNLGMPDTPFGLTMGDVNFTMAPDFGFNISLPSFSMSMPSLSGLQGLSLPDLQGFKVNGIDFDPNMTGLDISGFDLSTGIGTIGFDGLTGGLPLSIDFQTDKLVLKIDKQIDISFTMEGWEVDISELADLHAGFDYQNNFRFAKFTAPDLARFDITPTSLKIFDGDLEFLAVSPASLDFNMDALSFTINPELASITLPDALDFSLNPKGLDFGLGDISAGFNIETGINLQMPDVNLKLGNKRLDFNFSDYGIRVNPKLLSFSSPQFSFSTDNLMFDIGNYKFGLTLIDDIPSLQLKDFTTDVSINTELLGRFKFKEINMQVSPDLGFDFDYNNELRLGANFDFLRVKYDFIDVKVGLDTVFNFNYDDWKFFMKAIPDPGLFVNYKADYELGLIPDGLQFTHLGGGDFLRRVRLTPDFQAIYWEKEFDDFELSFGMPQGYAYDIGFVRGKYDFNFGKLSDKLNDYMVSEDYIAGLSVAGMGDLDVAFNKPGKFGARIEMPDGKWGWAAILPNGGFDIKGNFAPFTSGTAPEPELPDDSKVNMDGPQYIGSITKDAEGFAKGTAEVLWNKNKFFMQGAVTGGGLVCFDGNFALDIRDEDDFILEIGKPDKYVDFKPGCADNSIGGYLKLTPSSGFIGFGADFEWSQGFDFDVVKARAYAEYSFNSKFGIEYPDFKITEAEVAARFRAGVDAQFCAGALGCTKSTTLAGVSYAGKLRGNFDALYVTGKVSGEITVFGISSGEKSLNVSVGL